MAGRGLGKNLFTDFDDSENPSEDAIRVFLRLKPTENEKESVIEVIDSNTIIFKMPDKELKHVRKKLNVSDHYYKYTFTKIFRPEVTQAEIFEGSVAKHVKDLFSGGHNLLFTYGTSNAGKTFTVLGSGSEPGIIPRTLTTVFKSIKGKEYGSSRITPHMFNSTLEVTDCTLEEELLFKQKILTWNSDRTLYESSKIGKSHTSGQSADGDIGESDFKEMRRRLTNDTSIVTYDAEPEDRFSVWVCFAEIYNETIYDLLQPVAPNSKRKPLKLSSDNQKNRYIKDLKHINIETEEEAYKILLFGKKNLQVAATGMNSRSSRSHSIFTIKLIKCPNVEQPETVLVSSFSICDLAGADRQKKALNTGLRLKELQNINCSLHVLSRCFSIIRENQLNNENKLIPFRESKLTQLFQHSLLGKENVTMIVNVNPDQHLCEETQQVLKASAVAKHIVVQPKPVKRPPRETRKSLFSQVVDRHDGSTLICWDSCVSPKAPDAQSLDLVSVNTTDSLEPSEKEKKQEQYEFGKENEVKAAYLELKKEVETKLRGRDNLLEEARNDLVAEIRIREHAEDELAKAEKELAEKVAKILLLETEIEDFEQVISDKTNAIETLEMNFDQEIMCMEQRCNKLEQELAQKTSYIKEMQILLKRQHPDSSLLKETKCASVKEYYRSPTMGAQMEAPCEEDKPDGDVKLFKSNSKVKTQKAKTSVIPNLDVTGNENALETHSAQQTITVGTIETLHEDSNVSDPKGLCVKLLPPQNYCLPWLLWREKQKPSGGILAEDMGLEKTLLMISLILKSNEDNEAVDQHRNIRHEDSEDSSDEEDKSKLVRGKTLIVCPAPLVDQWKSEIDNKVKSGFISISIHRGRNRERISERLARSDVVITTYKILSQGAEESQGPLFEIRWERIILDNAHRIRNYKTKTTQGVFNLKARSRWALTDKPIDNKEIDLYGLLKFFRCSPFDDLADWKKWFDNHDAAGIQRLNTNTKSLMLRRTKQGLQDKGELKSLTEKKNHTVFVALDKEEQAAYEKLLNFSKTLFAQFLAQKAEKESALPGMAGSTVNNLQEVSNHLQASAADSLENLQNPFENHPHLARLHCQMKEITDVKNHHILVVLLRLRQFCCHPALIKCMLNHEDVNSVKVEDGDGLDIDMIDKLTRMSIGLIENEDTKSLDTDMSPLSSQNLLYLEDRLNSKMKKVLETIEEILIGDDKLIVVSQWVSILELINKVLRERSVKCAMITGSDPAKECATIVDTFNKKGCMPRVMLLPLTVGRLGLNLVGANHLLLLDHHWNPQLENQVCDRIYRDGQEKNVYIYKFVSSETIEERILKLQQGKLEIANRTGGKIESKLSLDDLKMLFQMTKT